jgi:oxygen-dependent protoporphyrinogen oxidase
VAGLAAAHRLRTLLGPSAEITVLEQTDRLGGKLRTVSVAGVALDVGAEAYLSRRPEATDLVTELGLAAKLTHPTDAGATVRVGGRTAPLPRRTFLGVPADPADLTEVLSPTGLRRVAAERQLAPLDLAGADVALGPLLRERFGTELADGLAEPLLGGVYAGRLDTLGLRATMPPLAAALDRGPTSLTTAAATVLGPPTARTGSVFSTLRGGLGTLPALLAERAGATVRLGTTVRELHRTEAGWRLVLGAAAGAHAPAEPVLDVDAVVVAVPAPAARRLLATAAPAAAAAYAGIEVASMAVVALAFDPSVRLPHTSGVLVGAAERDGSDRHYTIKAATHSSAKWAHLDGPATLVRASVGRHDDTSPLRAIDGLDDAELVAAVRADLADLTGLDAVPIDAVVTRWGGGLPQYGVGHLDLVAAIERAVAAEPGLAVAGAALHGVGIPACVATGDAAARRLAGQLETDQSRVRR